MEGEMKLECFRCHAPIPLTDYIRHGQVDCPEIAPPATMEVVQQRELECFQCKKPVLIPDYIDHMKFNCPQNRIIQEEIAEMKKKEKTKRDGDRSEKKGELRYKNKHAHAI